MPKRVKLILGPKQARFLFHLASVVTASDDEEVGSMIGSRKAQDLNIAYGLPDVILKAMRKSEVL